VPASICYASVFSIRPDQPGSERDARVLHRFTKCAPEPLTVVVFQNYLSYSALARADDEAVTGGFNDRSQMT
jgi:hypothetical protein